MSEPGPQLGPMKRPIRFNQDRYPFWRDQFPPEARQKMIHDDLFASESVSAMLMSIVIVGLCLGVTAIILTLKYAR